MAGETEDHRAGTNLWGLAVHQGQKDLVKQKSKVCQALLGVVLRPSLSCPSKPGAHGLLAGRLMQLSLWLSISEGYSLLLTALPCWDTLSPLSGVL